MLTTVTGPARVDRRPALRPTDPVAQHADHDIALLPADLTPAEARALLRGTGVPEARALPRGTGVVVADDGGVLGTVTAADLADAGADTKTLADWRGLPSSIEVDADLSLADLLDSPAVTLLLLGAPRLVLLRGGTPVAVFVVSRLAEYRSALDR